MHKHYNSTAHQTTKMNMGAVQSDCGRDWKKPVRSLYSLPLQLTSPSSFVMTVTLRVPEVVESENDVFPPAPTATGNSNAFEGFLRLAALVKTLGYSPVSCLLRLAAVKKYDRGRRTLNERRVQMLSVECRWWEKGYTLNFVGALAHAHTCPRKTTTTVVRRLNYDR